MLHTFTGEMGDACMDNLSHEELLDLMLNAFRGMQACDPNTRENQARTFEKYRAEVLKRMSSYAAAI